MKISDNVLIYATIGFTVTALLLANILLIANENNRTLMDKIMKEQKKNDTQLIELRQYKIDIENL